MAMAMAMAIHIVVSSRKKVKRETIQTNTSQLMYIKIIPFLVSSSWKNNLVYVV